MSYAKNSSQRVPGASETIFHSTLRDNWVYLSTEGAEITAIENNSDSPRSSGDRVSNEQSSQSNENLEKVQSLRLPCGIDTGALESNHNLENAIGLLHDFRQALTTLRIPTEALNVIEAELFALESAQRVEKETGESHPNIDASNELELGTAFSDASSDAPSALENYFDKAREVFVAKERLVELENEYHDNVRLESGSQPSDSEPRTNIETNLEYNQMRQQLLETVALAESDLSELREICARQGIEPELNRYRRISGRNKRPMDLIADCYQTYAATSLCGMRDTLASFVTNGGETAVRDQDLHVILDS
jgi:hypothetical protein